MAGIDKSHTEFGRINAGGNDIVVISPVSPQISGHIIKLTLATAFRKHKG
jgi:hypothetical protein